MVIEFNSSSGVKRRRFLTKKKTERREDEEKTKKKKKGFRFSFLKKEFSNEFFAIFFSKATTKQNSAHSSSLKIRSLCVRIIRRRR